MASILSTPSGRPLRETEDLDADYKRAVTERALAVDFRTQRRLEAEAANAAARERAVEAEPVAAAGESLQGSGPAQPANEDQQELDDDRFSALMNLPVGALDGIIEASRNTMNSAFQLAGAGLKAVGQENLAGVVEGAVDEEDRSVSDPDRRDDISYIVGKIGGQAASALALGVGALRAAGMGPGLLRMTAGDALGSGIAWDPEEEHLANALQHLAESTKNQDPDSQGFLANALRATTHAGAVAGATVLAPFAAEADDGPITSRLKLMAEGGIAGLFIDRAIELAKFGLKRREWFTRARTANMERATEGAITAASEETLLRANDAAAALMTQRTRLADLLTARRVAREAGTSPTAVAQEVLEDARARSAGAGRVGSNLEGASPEVRNLIEAAEFRAGASGESIEDAVDALGRGLETPRDALHRVAPELAQKLDDIVSPGGSLDEEISRLMSEVTRSEQALNDSLIGLSHEDARALAKLVDDARSPHTELDEAVKASKAERKALLDDSAREGAGSAAPARELSPSGAPLTATRRTLSGSNHTLRMAATRFGLADILDGADEFRALEQRLLDTTNVDKIDSVDVSKGLQAVAQIFGDAAAANTKTTLHGTEQAAVLTLENFARSRGGTAEGMAKMLDVLMPGVENLEVKITALRYYEQTLMDQAFDLTEAASRGDTLAQAKFARTVEMLAQINEARRGATRATARALNAHKLVKRAFSKTSERARMAALKDLDSFVDGLGGDEVMRRAALNFRKLAVNGPEAVNHYLKMSRGRLFGEMAVEYFINSVLSGPITHAVNFTSNTLTSVWLPSERMFFGAVKGLVKRDWVDILESVEMFRGVIAGFESQLKLYATASHLRPVAGGIVRGAWKEVGGNLRKALSEIGNSHTIRAIRSGEGQLLEAEAGIGHELSSRGRAISSENLSPNGIINRHGYLRKSFDFLGSVINVPSRLLMGGDELAKGMNYWAKMNGKAFREAYERGLRGEAADRFQAELKHAVAMRDGLTTGEASQLALKFGKRDVVELREYLDSIFDDAGDYAKYATFSENLSRGSIPWHVQQAARKHPLLRFIVPFVRTPVNIFKFSMQRVPGLGLLGGRTREMLKEGGLEAQIVWQRQLAGTALSISGLMLAANNRITGSGPSNPLERENLQAAGWKPGSIVWYDENGKRNYLSINRLEPIGFTLNLLADIHDLITGNDLDEAQGMEIAGATIGAFAELSKSRTFVTGLSLAIDSLRDPERGGPQMAERIAGGFMPNFIAQSAREISDDRAIYDVTAYNKAMETLGGLELVVKSMLAKAPLYGIPGAAGVVPRRNLFGEVVNYPPGFGPDIISPFYAGEDIDDPISRKMAELSDAGAGIRVNMKTFGAITVGDVAIPLKAEEADEWVRLTASKENYASHGGTMREDLNALVTSGALDGLSVGGAGVGPGGQVDFIMEIIDRRKQAAKNMLFMRHPELEQRALALKAGQKFAVTQEGQDGLAEFFKSLGTPDPREPR